MVRRKVKTAASITRGITRTREGRTVWTMTRTTAGMMARMRRASLGNVLNKPGGCPAHSKISLNSTCEPLSIAEVI